MPGPIGDPRLRATIRELDGEHTLDELIRDLRSADAGDRVVAARELRSSGPPPVPAMRPLLDVARRESDESALSELVLTLGETGLIEALGLIQTHAQSPVSGVRKAGRRALKAWLVRNRVLDEEDDLPSPPHPLYAGAPYVAPGWPASHALAEWELGAGSQAHPALPPRYEPPAPGGVPAGYHVDQVPRRSLVISGTALLGGGYVAALLGMGAALRDGNTGATVLIIPLAGPFLALETSSHDRTTTAGLGELVGDGILQVVGSGLLTAGLLATRSRLALDQKDVPVVSIGPASAVLTWPF
ncbi:hypothetical protein ACMHYB_10115 [Sorangium sp. So ce1128]